MTHNPLARQPRRIRPWILWGSLLLVVGSLAGLIVYQHVRQERARVAAEAEASAINGTTPRGIRFQPLGAYGPPEPVTPTNAVSTRAAPPPPAPAPPPRPAAKPIKRASMIYLVNEEFGQGQGMERLYTLAAFTYVPCVLENIVNSEIEGMFTVRTTRPTWDETGTVMLIPQGQRIGAQSQTAELLFGQERVPAWGLRTTINGTDVDLGQAPILDATGTLGLRDQIDNHVWRLLWSTLAIGTLNGGRQVIQTQIGQDGAGPIAGGIAQQGSQVTQQRLGRASDTRPTLTVRAGHLCNILTPRAIKLPAVGSVYSERR